MNLDKPVSFLLSNQMEKSGQNALKEMLINHGVLQRLIVMEILSLENGGTVILKNAAGLGKV